MKTFFKSILAVAVCASLFAACSKDDTVSDPSNGRKVTMTVTASSELGIRFPYDV
jgi:predicted component of type VI protein secretion system